MSTQLRFHLRPRSPETPVAEISLTVDDSSGSPRVQVAYFRLVDATGSSKSCRCYDDDAVVVDRNADGELLGIEVLAPVTPSEAPEFDRATRRDALLRQAMQVVVFWWRLLDGCMKAMADAGCPDVERAANMAFKLYGTFNEPSAPRWNQKKAAEAWEMEEGLCPA